ncbi:MAG TPA: peptidoglycan-binding domain-containing protein [Candidatus Paceibacterota bacterium]|nr:peptidoglycan-binding domain-containing protein [Candidatus Paceibacterota bacterium]
MKTKIIIVSIFAISLFGALAVRAESFPSFPMAFWGNVKIDNVSVPINTVINAYYDSVLCGTVTVKEIGIYGYPDSLKQKLLISEGSGPITFKFVKDGIEKTGINIISHSSFVAGETINKNLEFVTIIPATPTPTPTPTPTSTPAPITGGGGGGGGSYTPPSSTPTPTPTPILTSSPTPTPTPEVLGAFTGPIIIPILPANPTQADYQNLLDALLQQLAYLRSLMSGQVAGASTGYQFTHNLQLGDSGEDVTQLQTFLKAQGADIYPEGLVTGYFGNLTKLAVQRFQVKYDIAQPGNAGYGYVGPKTRAKMNSL